jgi:UDP-N-acetylglucosamine 3-dehydrogenase
MIRVGVVGTGGWGKNHVRVLSEVGALAAICEMDGQRRELYSKKYGVPGYASLGDMSRKENLDAVTVCTPASTHFKIASEALGSGLHTLVEKPMTTTASDAQSLIDIAKENKRSLTVGFIERFNPPISELKKTISEGKLGDLILLEFRRENRRGENIADVGIVKDASVHDIDTARWLFAEDPKTVFARVGAVKSKNEDFAAIVMGFSGRRTAFLTTNWVTPNRVRTLSAVFTAGVIDVDFVTQQTSIHEEQGTNIPTRPFQEPLLLELREFVNAVEEKRSPLITGVDGLRAITIAEAVLASSSSGAPIYLGN